MLGRFKGRRWINKAEERRRGEDTREKEGEGTTFLSFSLQTEWRFHGEHYGMPSWLLGEEEEEEEQVKAGGFFPAFPQRLKSVGGLVLSLSLSWHLTECGGGCVIICCSRKNERRLEVGGGGQLLQMSGPRGPDICPWSQS